MIPLFLSLSGVAYGLWQLYRHVKLGNYVRDLEGDLRVARWRRRIAEDAAKEFQKERDEAMQSAFEHSFIMQQNSDGYAILSHVLIDQIRKLGGEAAVREAEAAVNQYSQHGVN